MDTEGTWNEEGGSSFEGERQDLKKQELKQKARRTADRARGQVRSAADSGRSQLATQISGIGRALRDAGDKLREDEQGEKASQYTEMLADRADQISRFLEEHDASEIYGEVENVARKSPALFLGGCLAIGFALGRFLKAGSGEVGGERMPLGVSGEEGGERYVFHPEGRGDLGEQRFEGGEPQRQESGQERFETAPERDLTTPSETPVVTTEVIEVETTGPGYVQPVIGTKKQDGGSEGR